MAEDWRFEKSPHVEIGGLRAYAGVPLKFETEFGQHVAFGSLCVASNSPEKLLCPLMQQSLIRLADGIVSDIVHSARARRQSERRRMFQLIYDAQRLFEEHANMEQEIPKMLQEIYPGMEVTIQKTTDGRISLGNGTGFSTRELEHGLWEDTDYFDYAIQQLNHLDMTAPRAVRAIVAQCSSQCVPTFLVVACNDFKRVFDDVDSWFVQTCAVSINQNVQYVQQLLTMNPNTDGLVSLLAKPCTPGGTCYQGILSPRYHTSASDSDTWHPRFCRAPD
jgi:hypothetical protein